MPIDDLPVSMDDLPLPTDAFPTSKDVLIYPQTLPYLCEDLLPSLWILPLTSTDALS